MFTYLLTTLYSRVDSTPIDYDEGARPLPLILKERANGTDGSGGNGRGGDARGGSCLSNVVGSTQAMISRFIARHRRSRIYAGATNRLA